jgi:hypothetical protein
MPNKKTRSQLEGAGASQAQIDAYFAIGKTGRPVKWTEKKALGLMEAIHAWFLEDDENINLSKCTEKHAKAYWLITHIAKKYESVNELCQCILSIQKQRLFTLANFQTIEHILDDNGRTIKTIKSNPAGAMFQLKCNHGVMEEAQKEALKKRDEGYSDEHKSIFWEMFGANLTYETVDIEKVRRERKEKEEGYRLENRELCEGTTPAEVAKPC